MSFFSRIAAAFVGKFAPTKPGDRAQQHYRLAQEHAKWNAAVDALKAEKKLRKK